MANIATLSVTARRKSNFSLWKKVVKGGREGFDDVPDALGLRVVLEAKKLSPDETETETRYREAALCYYVQASAMSVFQEQGKRFVKDYIDKPKVNGYKSLHVGLGVLWHGRMWPVELQVRPRQANASFMFTHSFPFAHTRASQIRSAEMHRVAEFGIAAHWQYKTRETKTKALAKSDSTIDASLVSYLQGLRDHDAATTDVPPPPSPPTSFTRDAELLRQLNEQVRTRAASRAKRERQAKQDREATIGTLRTFAPLCSHRTRPLFTRVRAPGGAATVVLDSLQSRPDCPCPREPVLLRAGQERQRESGSTEPWQHGSRRG